MLMQNRYTPSCARSQIARLAMIILSVVVTVLGPACSLPSQFFGSVQPPAGNIFRVGLGADPESLDPALAGGAPEAQILINLFEGLVEYDASSSDPRPGVASSWQSNLEATQFTFILRPEAQWGNGDPVTAQDFIYSWRRALNPQSGSSSASLLFVIRNAEAYHNGRVPEEEVGISALDDHKLQVRLTAPTAHFPRMLAHPVFRPVHPATVERWASRWTEPDHMTSNGPFELQEWRPADRVTLKRNPRYWGTEQVKIDAVVYYLGEDYSALMSLYKAGEIDAFISGLLPLPYIPLLRNLRDYRTGAYLGTYFYAVNVKRPGLRDPRVRKALSLSIDRRSICEGLLRAGQSPAVSFSPSDFDGTYTRPNLVRFDPNLGKRLMAAAGHPDGRGLDLGLYFNTNETHREIAEAIQSQWQTNFPLIQVELINQEWQVFQSGLRRGSYDLARRFWTADYDDPTAFLEIMQSSSSSNYTGWGNADYDRLFAEAGAATDVNHRMELLNRAETILLSELPIIPIYSAVTYFLAKPYIEGWESNKLDRHPVKYVRFVR